MSSSNLLNPTDPIGAEQGASDANHTTIGCPDESGGAGMASTAEEGTAAGRNRSSSTVVRASPKFTWKYKITEMCYNPVSKAMEKSYPFLDDKNEQDFLFTQLLLAEAPYSAAYGNVKNKWRDFNAKLKQKEASDGSFPFNHIGENTAKSRFTKFQEVFSYWTDKTGARQVPSLNADEIATSDEDDTEYDVSTGVGSRGIAKQIRDAIMDIMDTLEKVEDEKTRATEAAIQQDWAEKGQVEELKASALGQFQNRADFPALDVSGSSHLGSSRPASRNGSRPESRTGFPPENTGERMTTPAARAPNNSKSTSGTRSAASSMESLTEVIHRFESDKNAMLEAQSLADAEREKRRLMTAEIDAKRLAVEERMLAFQEKNDAKRLAVEERKLSVHEMHESRRLSVEERKLSFQEENETKRLAVEDRKLAIQEKQIQMQADMMQQQSQMQAEMMKQQNEMLKHFMEQLAKKN